MNRLLAGAMVFFSMSAVTGAVAQRPPEACTWQDGSCSAIAAAALQSIIANSINSSKDDWMKAALNKLMDKFPGWSVVLVANGLGPVQGCIHQHAEMPVVFGTTAVEIFFAKEGTTSCSVQHYGDGGWRNWAYGGWWTRSGDRVYIQ